ncbi:MAG: CRISPR-associated ring nuclease [Anaerolineae bacterium]|nr:CRISPR-associated ring nuclease [Anaerolineae bacterium]
MPLAFLATLGQAPEAITFALDKLLHEGYSYDRIVILHTDPQASAIRDAYKRLMPVLARDYAAPAIGHELRFADDKPLVDITDEASALAYFAAVGKVLYLYKAGYVLHLLVSGGRKAMSIYAMIAASVLFTPRRDMVLTVLSSESLLAQQGWHIPLSAWEQVQLVSLPFVPLRRVPNEDPSHYFSGAPFSNPHAEFLATLSREELALAEAIRLYPYDTNDQLARRLSKSVKTLNNQLNAIYGKMRAFYGNTVPEATRRIALLDILREGS